MLLQRGRGEEEGGVHKEEDWFDIVKELSCAVQAFPLIKEKRDKDPTLDRSKCYHAH